MSFNFPRTAKTVPEYVYKCISRAGDLYSDFLAYAASHAGGLQTQHLFNIQMVKNDLLHVLDCVFERPEKDDVFQQFREELLAEFPTLEEEYNKLVKEVSKYESDNCYKKDLTKNNTYADSNTSMALQRDSEQIDNQSLMTQDAQSVLETTSTFPAKDFSILLPTTMQLPHHVIYISENDKLDLRSLGAGRLVIFNIKKHIRQLKAQGVNVQIPDILLPPNQDLEQTQTAQLLDKDEPFDIEEDTTKAMTDTPQTAQQTEQQSIQTFEQKESNVFNNEPLVTYSEAPATEKTTETSSNQITLLIPKSLKLMLIKQKRFSSELKIEQVVNFLSMKSNYTRESVCQLNPDEITPQTFRNIKPTLLKGEDGPKPRFSSLKPQQIAKLNEHIYIPKQYEVLSEREASHAQKVQDFNKFLYFDLCTIEQNQTQQLVGQQFSFLPTNQNATYQGSGFLNNISVCGLGTKQQQQPQHKQPQTIQGIIKYVHSDCIQPFIDIYEDQLTYQFKIDQIVLVYDKTKAGFMLGRILMPASRQSRFHCHVQLLYVNKDMLKQRMLTMKKNKKLPIDILRQSIVYQEPSPENCLLIYTRFVLPVNIDQSLLEDCL